MAVNTFKCNYLTPLHFRGLTSQLNVPRSFTVHGQHLLQTAATNRLLYSYNACCQRNWLAPSALCKAIGC